MQRRSKRTRRALTFMVAAILLFTPRADAQVVAGAAVNSASYLHPGLPNGKLAQGVLFIVFGSGIGPAALEQASAYPLETRLAGTSIRVTVGGTAVDCPMVYAFATQLAAILPSTTPVGAGTLIVTYNGQSSAPLAIEVAASAFGIYSLNQSGQGPGIMVEPVGNVTNTLVTPAQEGQFLDIWGTGLGAAAADDKPAPGDLAHLNVEAFVGGAEAQVVYRGRSGCCAGVDQVRIVVPAGARGCHVPVYLVVDGAPSNFVTMSVAPAGSLCEAAGGLDASVLQTAIDRGSLRFGTLDLHRGRDYEDGRVFRSDSAGAGFHQVSLGTLIRSAGLVPSLGSCVVNPFPAVVGPEWASLDAAQVSLAGPPGALPLHRNAIGDYGLSFLPGAQPAPGRIVDGRLLTPGAYTFTGTGAADVGAFSASLDVPALFEWTNRGSIGAVSRSQPLRIAWDNAAPGSIVAITGVSLLSLDLATGAFAGAIFSCWTEGSRGEFTVPPAVLSSLPSTLVFLGEPLGSLHVDSYLFGRFSAAGLDVGATQSVDQVSRLGVRFE
jgi:uncharacterized protein (TIGR03437 family)